MKIKWVRLALADLEEAAEFIAQDNPDAAKRNVKRIWDSTQLLAEHPHAGRAGRIPGTRELVITGTPFIIPYRVVEDTVQILRVLYGKRKWLKGFAKEGDSAVKKGSRFAKQKKKAESFLILPLHFVAAPTFSEKWLRRRPALRKR